MGPVGLLRLQALLDEVELVAQGLIAVRHTDLRHVGFADVVALWTLFEVILTQEVALLLQRKKNPTKKCFNWQLQSKFFKPPLVVLTIVSLRIYVFCNVLLALVILFDSSTDL